MFVYREVYSIYSSPISESPLSEGSTVYENYFLRWHNFNQIKEDLK